MKWPEEDDKDKIRNLEIDLSRYVWANGKFRELIEAANAILLSADTDEQKLAKLNELFTKDWRQNGSVC